MRIFLIVFSIFLFIGGFFIMVLGPSLIAGAVAILTLGFIALILASASIIGYLSEITDEIKRWGRQA